MSNVEASECVDQPLNVHWCYRIAKGNKIIVPIMAMHRSRELWGDDAMEFKYVRFLPQRVRIR